MQELHNDYYLVPDKIKFEREILSDSQLKIANLYNISIGNVKKFVTNFFDKEKYIIHYKNLQLCLRLGLKLKNISCIRIQSVSMAETICWIQHTKKNSGKVLYKLMNNAVYGKTMENLRTRIDVKLVSNKTFKMDI